MIEDFFYKLTTPLVLLVFAGVFGRIWLQQKYYRSALFIAVAYLLAASAFGLEIFIGHGTEHWQTGFLIENAFLLSCGMLLAGVALLFSKPIPIKRLAALYLGSLCFIYLPGTAGKVDPIVNIYVLCSACSFMMAIAYSIGKSAAIGATQRLSVLTFGFAAIQLMATAAFFLLINQGIIQSIEVENSVFVAALNFGVVVLSMYIALGLMLSIEQKVFSNLKVKSETDSMTGLLNRAAFEDAFKSEIDKSASIGLPLSLVVADIDHFKEINDSYGHDVGDKVICSFAQTLGASVRIGDYLARVGGEEFCLLLPTADISMARLIAEAARSDFEKFPHQAGEAKFYRTASFGIAEFVQADSPESLFKRADDALYDAKNSGRNCVAVTDVSARIEDQKLSANS